MPPGYMWWGVLWGSLYKAALNPCPDGTNNYFLTSSCNSDECVHASKTSVSFHKWGSLMVRRESESLWVKWKSSEKTFDCNMAVSAAVDLCTTDLIIAHTYTHTHSHRAHLWIHYHLTGAILKRLTFHHCYAFPYQCVLSKPGTTLRAVWLKKNGITLSPSLYNFFWASIG